MKKFIIPIYIILCLIAYTIGCATTTTTDNLELVMPATDDETVVLVDTINANMVLIDAGFDDPLAYSEDTIVKADFADEDWGDMSVSSNSVTLDEDVVDATALKDGNTPADEDIFSYESTGTTGHWYSRDEVGIKYSKFDATEAPDADNDTDEGYVAGSIWVDVTNDNAYICLDNSDGVAVWSKAAPSGGTGSVDTSGTPENDDWSRFTDADTIEGLSDAELIAALSLEIGVDILAQQTIGIANDNLVEMDDADAADNDYAKFTVNGLEGRSYSETRNDLQNYIVYPQDYATGAGTSGDPWAGDCLTDAYTACPTGGTIYLRAGYYLLSGAFSISKSINIIGEGRNKSIIVTADATALYIEADRVTLKGFTVDGDAQTDGEARDCINLDGDYFVLEDIEVKNAGYYGIALTGCDYSVYHDIYAHDNYGVGVHPNKEGFYNNYQNIYCWDNGNQGFSAGDSSSSISYMATNNVYDNIHAWDNAENGIAIGNQSDIVITNSSAWGNIKAGIYLADLKNSIVSNCFAYNNDYGVQLNENVQNINLTNIIAKNNGDMGILIKNCSDIALNSCQSYDERVVIGTDIAFVDGGAGADTITQTAARFLAEGFFATGEITITGDSDNNGVYTIVSVVAGTITLATGQLTAEAAGDSVTITHEMAQGYSVALEGTNTGISLLNCKLAPNAMGNNGIYNEGGASTYNWGIVDDDIDLVFGNDRNWLVQYDEGVDDQLLWITAGTNAGADTDAMFEIITGASMDADQQCFAVSKGTQASKTTLFYVDEDGDVAVTAALTAASYGGITEANLLDKSASESITADWDSTGTFDIANNNAAAGGDAGFQSHIIQITNGLTGTLHGAYITASNNQTNASSGTIRAIEAKARAESVGGSGGTVAVLEGVSISADSKDQSVTTMRGMEVMLDGSTGGTVTEGVGIRIANNMQADKTTTMTALQIYSDSFAYDYGIDLSQGVGGITTDIKLSNGETIVNNPDGVIAFDGDIDFNNKRTTEVATVEFNGVYAIGNSGATETIDWQNGAYQSITIDEACVISFSNEYVGTLNLRVTYGGEFALTFDGGITLLEEGGVEIVTTDNTGVDDLFFKNWGVADEYTMGALLDVKD